MALLTISISDFTGYYNLSQSTFQQSDFGEFITRYNKQYMRYILGDEATDYIENEGSLPQKYIDLLNGVVYSNTVLKSDPINKIYGGLKDVLKGFIYYEYIRNYYIHTPTGMVKNNPDNSVNANGIQNLARANDRYNDSIAKVNEELYLFLCNYEELTKSITGFVDNGGGSYTIQLTDTTYLNDGDTVLINGVEYIVSSLVTNTSFNITGNTGLTFSGDFEHYPFEKVEFEKLDYTL